jgi:hypothetical protein
MGLMGAASIWTLVTLIRGGGPCSRLVSLRRSAVVAGPGLGWAGCHHHSLLPDCGFSSSCWPAMAARSKRGKATFLGVLCPSRGFPLVVLSPLALSHGASRPPRLVSDKPLRWGFAAETILVRGTSNKCVVAVPFVCRTDEPSRLTFCGSGRRCGQRPIGSPRGPALVARERMKTA